MGENLAKKPSSLKLFSIALGTFILLFSSAVVSNSMTYFIVAVTEYLGVTRAEFSVYYTIVSFATAGGSLFCGAFISKLGNRRAFLIATVGVTCGFLLLSRLTALWMVFVAAAIIGFSQAFVLVPPVAVVNAWFPKKFNGLVMGTTMAGTGFGGIIMAQVMTRVVAYVSWRTGYLICAIMFCALSLLGNVLCGGKTPELAGSSAAAEGGKKAKKDAEYWKRVLTPAFLIFLFTCFLKCFSSVFNTHLSAHLGETFSVEQVATAMTVFNVSLLIMKISQGAMYDKFGYKVMLVLVAISSIAYLGLLSSSFGLVLVSIAILMFTCSTETVMAPLFITEMYDKQFSGQAWGLAWAMLYFGNAAGAVFWGWIYDKFGNYGAGLRFNPVIIVVYCLLVFTAITLAKKRKARDAAKAPEQN